VAGHEPPKAHPHLQPNCQLTPGILKGEGKGVAIHLIDIGVNLTHRSFQSDREAVSNRAVAAGVVHLFNTGTTVKGSQDGRALARAHPRTVFKFLRSQEKDIDLFCARKSEKLKPFSVEQYPKGFIPPLHSSWWKGKSSPDKAPQRPDSGAPAAGAQDETQGGSKEP
jgi:hypothetical protein